MRKFALLTVFAALAVPSMVLAQGETEAQLAEVREATAIYHDVRQAEADGYVAASPNVPGMGVHYINFDLLDGEAERTQPEALLYRSTRDGLRLVGVEYVVPAPAVASPPDLFAGDADHWHTHHAACHYADGSEVHADEPSDCPETAESGAALVNWHPNLRTLHAWVWHPNPNGVFAETNPAL